MANPEQQSLQQALLLHQSGKLDEAVAAYRETIAQNRNNVQAQQGLAMALIAKGQPGQAIAPLQAALKLQPKMPDIWNTLGNCLKAIGNIPAAIQALQFALQHKPDHTEALNNLALIHWQQCQFNEAAAMFTRAIQSQPENEKIVFNFAVMLESAGKNAEAAAAFQKAAELKPDFAEAWNNLGILRTRLLQHDEAIEAYTKAIESNAGFAEPLVNIGNIQSSRGQLQEAEASFDKALAIDPANGRALVCKELLMPTMMESMEAIDATRQKLDTALDVLLAKEFTLKDPLADIGQTCFFLTYHGRNDLPFQQKFARLYIKTSPILQFTAPHCRQPQPKRPGEKIRIGFISTFFYQHTIAKLNLGLIEQLPRDRFEVELFITPHDDDKMRQALIQAADHVTTLPPSKLQATMQIIASRQLDVVFYPDIGMEPLTYFLGFARLAPVQCVTWGHPVTTGLPQMDYFISSEHLDTEDAQEHYSEQLVRLPQLAVSFSKPTVEMEEKTRVFFGLDPQAHLYICPQSLFKFHPEYDEVLAQILRKDPQGRLMLIESNKPEQTEALKARFARTIPDVTDRIDYLKRLSGEDFIRVIGLCDVMLDPLHFGGGNTVYEGLSMGTPVVTLPSEFLRGRIAYALYKQIGYTDLIAKDAEDYVALAVKLATDPDFREQARKEILSRHDQLYNDPRGIAAFAEWCEEAVRKTGEKMRVA